MNPRERFRDRLQAQRLLADGAMGTLLFSRGIPQRACLDELATTRPDLIGAVHRQYIDAGAGLIETATFGANRVRLAEFGLDSRAHALNRRAAQVAREARDVAGRDVLVAGSIGPLGPPTGEVARKGPAAVRGIYREQIDGLLEGGVDLFVIETFGSLELLLAAIEEARSACDLPVVAEMTFGEELIAADGTTPEQAQLALAAADVDAIGVNCGAGPYACLAALQRMSGWAGEDGLAARRSPVLSLMPNAGLPRRVEGQFVYAADPDYFGLMATRAAAAGARIIGGCCGTTPEHIAAMRLALDALEGPGASEGSGAGSTVGGRAAARSAPAAPSAPVAPSARAAPVAPSAPIVQISMSGPVARDAQVAPLSQVSSVLSAGAAATIVAAEQSSGGLQPSRLAAALADRRFVVSVEIDPPRSIRIDRTVEAARLLQAAGVDIVNVSDSAMARVRMGGLAVAFAIQHDLDLECLVHFTTRDRNLMALESELLGAHALGVRNVLALTGDPPRIGDYPTATGVWDVDAIGLIGILSRLNRGEDAAGSPIGQAASFTVACALDPTAPDQATEWERLERKLVAGAHVIMTQPLYSLAQLQAMDDEARVRFGPSGFPVPVLLGVLPLQSARHAEFLHNEVPGITIPAETREALAAAGDRGADAGLEMALALLAQARGLVAGTYIMPSFGRYEQAAELARRVRLLPA